MKPRCNQSTFYTNLKKRWPANNCSYAGWRDIACVVLLRIGAYSLCCTFTHGWVLETNQCTNHTNADAVSCEYDCFKVSNSNNENLKYTWDSRSINTLFHWPMSRVIVKFSGVQTLLILTSSTPFVASCYKRSSWIVRKHFCICLTDVQSGVPQGLRCFCLKAFVYC